MSSLIKKFIYQQLRLILGLLVVLFSFIYNPNKCQAVQVSAGDLSYIYLGGNQYLISFSLYVNCSGGNPGFIQSLNINSASCGFNQVHTMDTVPDSIPGPVVDVFQNINGSITTCHGGLVVGIQVCKYSALVVLPLHCADWRFSVAVSTRDSSITNVVNLSNTDFYAEAFLNNTIGDNNSPILFDVPLTTVCLNQDNYSNIGIYDSDGDSIAISFIIPKSGPNSSLTFKSGYSAVAPIISNPPASIDPNSSFIYIHPTQPDVCLISILIEEFRNGQLISSITRDWVFFIIYCPPFNWGPKLTGIDSTNSYSAIAYVGQALCFDVYSSHPDTSLLLTLAWNNSIPGATFSTSANHFPVGHFCWTPTLADTSSQPYYFTISVLDNALPVHALSSYAFTITVLIPTFIESTLKDPSLKAMIFPNPFYEKARVKISTSGGNEYYYVKILNNEGRLVKSLSNAVNEDFIFERNNLSSGEYYLQLENTRSKQHNSFKFIVVEDR